MIRMDVNLQIYFNAVPDTEIVGDREKCEEAFEELFDDVFAETKEYIETKARIQKIKEVEE